MKSVIAVKVNPGRQSLEKGLSCIFQAIGNVLSQRCSVSMPKHWQHSTKVRDKEIKYGVRMFSCHSIIRETEAQLLSSKAEILMLAV